MKNNTKTTETQKIANAWLKFSNPLRGLTSNAIEQMMMNAKHGNDIKLQLAFYEIERLTPIFNVCIEKRLAGVINRQWDIVPLDDSDEAKSQTEKIKKIFLKCDTRNEDGLTDAIRHLSLSTFRGRSAVKPFFDDEGNLLLKRLHNWNLMYYNNNFYWNPQCNDGIWLDDGFISNDIQFLPKDEICYLINDRPIDYSGIIIYLRQLVGEEQYSRFLEKCGIPQVLLTAPEGTPDTNLEVWNYRA
jgi:hypothetical protein